jgi:hypothetical protein
MNGRHGSKVDLCEKKESLLEVKVHRQQTNIIMNIEMTAMFIINHRVPNSPRHPLLYV